MLKVLTLNLNYYVDKHGPWATRREIIRAAIASARPDVMAFQAVRRDPAVADGLDQAEQLAGLFPEYRFAVFKPAVEYLDGSAEGSAIVARVVPAELDSLRLTLLPGLEDSNHRLVLHARLDLAGGPFHLFNAHFSWVAQQTRLNVEEALPYLRAVEGPALLVGDLNAPAGEDRLSALRQAGWTDVWARLRPDEPGNTFESNAPSIRIDYAWANAAVLPRVQSIDLVAQEVGEGGARASDHVGLVIGLNV